LNVLAAPERGIVAAGLKQSIEALICLGVWASEEKCEVEDRHLRGIVTRVLA
jgi:hypothetical protein